MVRRRSPHRQQGLYLVKDCGKSTKERAGRGQRWRRKAVRPGRVQRKTGNGPRSLILRSRENIRRKNSGFREVLPSRESRASPSLACDAETSSLRPLGRPALRELPPGTRSIALCCNPCPSVHLPPAHSEDPVLVTRVACASSPTHVESREWQPVFPLIKTDPGKGANKLIRTDVEMSGVSAEHGKQQGLGIRGRRPGGPSWVTRAF